MIRVIFCVGMSLLVMAGQNVGNSTFVDFDQEMTYLSLSSCERGFYEGYRVNIFASDE